MAVNVLIGKERAKTINSAKASFKRKSVHYYYFKERDPNSNPSCKRRQKIVTYKKN